MKKLNILQLVFCIAIPLVAGAVSGVVTVDAIDGWYATLNKPFFNPPDFIFGPVWTTLYILMGISLYMIVRSVKSTMRSRALIIFGVQLFLNFVWSFLFFYFEHPDFALLDIIPLWAFILWMIIAFKEIRPIAGYLQIPYLLWVSFATLLNAAIWWLNM